jgi:hypothetical protein
VEDFMSRKGLLLMASLAIVAWPLSIFSQNGRIYEDKTNGFRITLLGDWRAVSYNDAVGRQKSEFVYRDRSEGLLRITRDSLGPRAIGDIEHEEEESARAYRSGFELADKETFGGGALRGLRLAYYYVDSGRKIAATMYFLQDGNQVWELKFTGKRGVLDLIRNVTDEMARSLQTL